MLKPTKEELDYLDKKNFLNNYITTALGGGSPVGGYLLVEEAIKAWGVYIKAIGNPPESLLYKKDTDPADMFSVIHPDFNGGELN